MDRNNRPESRKKHVTGNSQGVHRRGEGLGTGPVGSGSTPQNTPASGRESYGGQTPRVTRGGGKGGLLAIIIAAVVLLGGGGGGLLGGLFGGGGETTTTTDYSDYGISPGTYQSIVQSSADTQPAQDTAATAADTTVASGSRAKYTAIKGGGKDTVTIMVYMCGTDLESKNGMGTNDLMEMTKAQLNGLHRRLQPVAQPGGQ